MVAVTHRSSSGQMFKNAHIFFLAVMLASPFARADFEQDLSATGNNLPTLRELHARAISGDANAQLERG